MITCTFENGNIAKKGLRHVTVCALVVNEKTQVLLVKRSMSVPRPNLYALPGGYLDRGETTVQCALRELQEETGFTGEVHRLFHINDSPARPHEDKENVDFIYVVTNISGKESRDTETASITWFSEDSLPPDEAFAFDHNKVIKKYFAQLNNPFAEPVIGAL